MIYTAKQRELLRLWQKGGLRRINLLEGSVSSGKTWVSLVLWAFWVASMPQAKSYLMCGKSLIALKRNCLLLLQELVGESNFTFSIQAKEGYLFGRRVFLEGANDARSESKIRGMTLQGAYCDELTQFPEDFFTMLLSRLRLPGAKLIATTNPDAPLHWLKTKYIERAGELDFLDVTFTLDDNTTLPQDYVDNLKKEYTGVFYDRFILGLWTKAQGLVYPFFNENDYTTDAQDGAGRYFVSIDYGTTNPCAFGLWRLNKGHAVMVKEYYFASREEHEQKTDDEYYVDLEKFTQGRKIEQVILDPSAASFKAVIRKHGKFSVKNAKNDVLDGIRITSTLMKGGHMLFDKSCKNTIKEFGAYAWDEKKHEDAVIKENDHSMDQIRYFAATVLAREVKACGN